MININNKFKKKSTLLNLILSKSQTEYRFFVLNVIML